MADDFLAKITPEGRARARAKLDAARAEWPPERFAALRERMGLGKPPPPKSTMTIEELLASVGVVVTPEGLARARARLDAARAEWPPERFAAVRERLGLKAGGHRVRPLDGSPAYPENMAERDQEKPMTTDEMLAAVGIVVTPEGKARARAKLDAARAKWTPERRNALRRQLGFPPHDA